MAKGEACIYECGREQRKGSRICDVCAGNLGSWKKKPHKIRVERARKLHVYSARMEEYVSKSDINAAVRDSIKHEGWK